MAIVLLDEIDDKVRAATEEQFISYLFSPSCVWSEVIFLSSLVAGVFKMAPPEVISCLVGASCVGSFSSLSKIPKKTRRFAINYRRELLRQTDEYAECKVLYDAYVGKLKEFMDYVKLDNSLEVGMAYMYLLYGGVLSSSGEFSYHNYFWDKDICPELWGARVTSGRAVCRHIAANLVDLYKVLGYTASYMSVKESKNNVRSVLYDRLFPTTPNHAVVNVRDEFGKYIFDPTWKTVAVFGVDEAFATIIWGKKNKPAYHINYNEFLDRERRVIYDDYAVLREVESAQLRRHQVELVARKIKANLSMNEQLIRDFRGYVVPDLSQMAFLEKQISCYTDQRKKKEDVKKLSKKKK